MGIFFCGRLSSPPTGPLAQRPKLNSIDTITASWGHLGVINIPTAFSRPVRLTRLDMIWPTALMCRDSLCPLHRCEGLNYSYTACIEESTA